MQPQFVKVPDALQASFLIRDMMVPYFANPYHYHPELELTYISRGTGTRYIGDNIETFSEEDLVLVGSNLPHLWKNDEIYYKGNPYLKARAIVIQFGDSFLGNAIWELSEMKKIKLLIKNARQGIKIENNTQKKIAPIMQEMIDQSGAERIISLLMILYIISEAKDTKLLSSKAFSYNSTQAGLERINSVFAFIFEKFSENITLNQISDVANMSPTAFCRYFKSHTNKSFSLFLIETRIHHSCKLIMNEEMKLSEIAFKSGFNSLSYFTKQFKKVTGLTPLEYKKKIINGSRH
ncbi:MAG TPA: AraC family transcriptional regulator [Candidatus Babeliaceae bacterium]|nr:AraC family transcriptional regulator [Candidatus Babeliaceae bacterium]